MKRIYLLAFTALVVSGFVSCDKTDDDKQISGGDSSLTGVWAGDPELSPHYAIVTFNEDGSYVWQWEGIHRLKDAGKYSYSDKEIKMNISEYWEQDYSGETNDLKKTDAPMDYDGIRTCKVIEINPGILSVEVFGDYFMGGGEYGFPFVLFREGLDQNLTTSDFQGKWEGYDESGKVCTRVIFDGNNYTSYNVWTDKDRLVAMKQFGTWSVSKNVLSQTPVNVWYSYETGVDSNNKTVYTYSTVNPETFEADEWTPITYTARGTSNKVYLGDGKLYIGEAVIFKK